MRRQRTSTKPAVRITLKTLRLTAILSNAAYTASSREKTLGSKERASLSMHVASTSLGQRIGFWVVRNLLCRLSDTTPRRETSDIFQCLDGGQGKKLFAER